METRVPIAVLFSTPLCQQSDCWSGGPPSKIWNAVWSTQPGGEQCEQSVIYFEYIAAVTVTKSTLLRRPPMITRPPDRLFVVDSVPVSAILLVFSLLSPGGNPRPVLLGCWLHTESMNGAGWLFTFMAAARLHALMCLICGWRWQVASGGPFRLLLILRLSSPRQEKLFEARNAMMTGSAISGRAPVSDPADTPGEQVSRTPTAPARRGHSGF